MHSLRNAFDGLRIQECCAYAVTWLLAGNEVRNDAVWETNKVRGNVRNWSRCWCTLAWGVRNCSFETFWCEFLSCASCPSWRSVAIMSSSYLTYRNTWSKCRQTDYILPKCWGTCQKNGTSAVISDDLKHLRCFYRLRMIDDYFSAATTQQFTPLHLNWGLYSGWNFLRTAGWVAPPLFDGLLNGTVEWPRQGHPKRLVCSCLQTGSEAHPWKVIVASMLTLKPHLAANQTSEWNIRIRLAMGNNACGRRHEGNELWV